MEHLLRRVSAWRKLARVGVVVAGIGLATHLVDARPAQAQPAPIPPDEARQLFMDATQAMSEGAFQTACPKLERVIELVPDGIGAKLALGDCYLGTGRLASAQRAYVGAEAAAAAANQSDRQKEARSRADALGPRLAKLTLDLAPELRALPDLSISRDGVPIGTTELGLPIAVDAGTHVIVVSARDRQPRVERLELMDGDKLTVTVTELAPRPVEAPKIAPYQPPVVVFRRPEPAPAEFWGAQRVAGLVLGLGGVAGVGIGATFGALTKVAVDDSNDLGCDPDTAACPTQAAFDRRSEALTFAHASTGTLVAGGVLLAAGVVVFATAPSSDVEVALGPGGLDLRGSF